MRVMVEERRTYEVDVSKLIDDFSQERGEHDSDRAFVRDATFETGAKHDAFELVEDEIEVEVVE